MSAKVDIYKVWHQYDDFELEQPAEDTYCEAAAAFATWAADLVDRVNQDPNDIAVNQAILHLTHRYFNWYAAVSRRHQNHIGLRGGHTCIYQVFSRTYALLRALELSVVPPRIFKPPPPPKDPVVHVPALYIAEYDD